MAFGDDSPQNIVRHSSDRKRREVMIKFLYTYEWEE